MEKKNSSEKDPSASPSRPVFWNVILAMHMNALFDQSRRKASCIDPHNCGAAPKKVVTRGYRTMMRVRAPARERQNFLGRGENTDAFIRWKNRERDDLI